MRQPDVRWDGVSHQQIIDWTKSGAGTKATVTLEDGLQRAADALSQTGDLVNSVLQRVNGGEWTGNAATVAARAMHVMRDFDDRMGHHSTVNHLAAYGQSDNANWAKASIPAVVDLRAARLPTGNPADVLGNTVDYQHAQAEAKDAEEKARQVMRQYQTMTTDRIGALPPLSPAPRLLVADEPDTINVPPPGGTGPGSAREDFRSADLVYPGAAGPPPGGGSPNRVPVSPPGSGPHEQAPSVTDPAGTAPADSSGTTTPRTPVTAPPVGGGPGAAEAPRTNGTPFGGFTVGGPGADGGRNPLRGGEQRQPIGAGPRSGGPGAGTRGGVPEVVGRSAVADVLGRGAAKGGGLAARAVRHRGGGDQVG